MVGMNARSAARAAIPPVLAALFLGLISCEVDALRQSIEAIVDDYKAWGASWSEPLLIESRDGYARAPRAAFGPDGYALVAWEQYRSLPDWSVFAARYAGGTWAPEVELDLNAGSSGWPEVALGAGGYGMILFMQQDGSDYRPYVRRWVGGAWSAGGYLDSDVDWSLSEPLGLGMDGDGKAIALWTETNTTTISVVKVRRHDGTAWDAEATLSSGFAGFGRLAIRPDGNAVAVWNQNDAPTAIHASRYSGGPWGASSAIDGSPDDCNRPRLALAPGGVVFAMWFRVTTDLNLAVAKFDGASWAAPTDLEAGAANAGAFAIAASPRGEALAVWSQTLGAASDLYSSWYDGDTWTAPVLVEHSSGRIGTFPGCDPKLAFLPDGSAIAVWIQDDEAGDEAVYRARFRDGAWEAASSFPRRGVWATTPVLAVSPEGRVLVAWVERTAPSGDYDEDVYVSTLEP